MPTRWVICPVILDRGVRKPKVSIIPDPGIPPYQVLDQDGNVVTMRKTYKHSSAIGAGNWALCFVRGVDMSALDSDPDIILVLDENDDDLSLTPKRKRWNQGRLQRQRKLLSDRGASLNGLTEDSPSWEWLQRLGKVTMPDFTPKGTWVR